MSFGRPEFFWLLLGVAAFLPWIFRGRGLRARSWRELAQRGRAPGLRSLSMLAAAVLLIVAMARPRFGPVVGPPLPPGHDVVLQIDVSRSMGAEDAVPSRLAVAIEAAASLVDALAGDPANRAAVVAFAGRGVVRYPLTENLGAVKDVVRRLQPGAVQPGGTDLGAGLDAAFDALGQEEHSDGRAIVIFSDGEDHAEHWRTRLDRLSQAGVIVHGVAIGDADQGHPVPSGTAGQALDLPGRAGPLAPRGLGPRGDRPPDRRRCAEARAGAGRPRRTLPVTNRSRGQEKARGDAGFGTPRAVPSLSGGWAWVCDRGLLARGTSGPLALALEPHHRGDPAGRDS